MSWTTERARVASLTRSRTPDDPELVGARRNLKAERLADYITRTVDAAPALSAEQRDRLALLLRGSPPGTAPPAAPGGTKSPDQAAPAGSWNGGPAGLAGDAA